MALEPVKVIPLRNVHEIGPLYPDPPMEVNVAWELVLNVPMFSVPLDDVDSYIFSEFKSAIIETERDGRHYRYRVTFPRDDIHPNTVICEYYNKQNGEIVTVDKLEHYKYKYRRINHRQREMVLEFRWKCVIQTVQVEPVISVHMVFDNTSRDSEDTDEENNSGDLVGELNKIEYTCKLKMGKYQESQNIQTITAYFQTIEKNK